MLHTHIDKEVFYDAYRKSLDPLSEVGKFVLFLKNDTNLNLYGVDKSKFDNRNNLLIRLIEGKKETSSSYKLHETDCKNALNDIDQNYPYQILFLKTKDPMSQLAIAKKNKIAVAFIDNYFKSFQQLSKEPFFSIDSISSNNQFLNWKNALPGSQVTDIIISDPYILFYNNDYPLNKNYYHLLSELKNTYPKIETVFVFSYLDNDSDREESSDYESNWDDIILESKNILGLDVNFYLVQLTGIIEHDRHIFLNYHHLKFGSSLNFLFNFNGELAVKKTSIMKVESYFTSTNFNEAALALKKMKLQLFEQKKRNKISYDTTSNLFNLKLK